MDPIEPWIDADEVRRMAQRLTAPVAKAPTNAPVDPGFGPGFEGFIGSDRKEDSSPPLQKSHPEPRPAPETPTERPAQSVPVVERHSEDEPKPFLISQPAPSREADVSGERGPLVARMEKFRQWLAEKVDARGMFVLDREGSPVIDDPVYGKLHFLARSLAQAYRPSNGGAGNVHVKIGSDAYLAVVPVKTDFGALVLGAVLPEPLEASAVESIAKGLTEALRPERR